MQHAAIEWLAPDLVVLDEVQRFRDVLAGGYAGDAVGPRHASERQERLSKDSTQALGRILFRGKTKVLLLSATPWRALSLRGDDEGHQRELRETLAFLFRSERDADHVIERLEPLSAKILDRSSRFERPDDELRTQKLQVEAQLARVMSRTERSSYAVASEGVEAAGQDSVPTGPELNDYVALGLFLRKHAVVGPSAAEFWKACPLPLTFLDSSYRTFERLRHKSIPAGLIAKRNDLTSLIRRNHRIQNLHRLFRPDSVKAWDRLWVAPRVPYYKSGRLEDHDARKFLVFSGWRFVPRAIAAILSSDVEQSVGLKSGPLPTGHELGMGRSGKGLATILDVCFPSDLLAGLVDPLTWVGSGAPPSDLVEEARTNLEDLLQSRNVTVVERGGLSRWRLIARIRATG